jgi:hypothetical protein
MPGGVAGARPTLVAPYADCFLGEEKTDKNNQTNFKALYLAEAARILAMPVARYAQK